MTITADNSVNIAESPVRNNSASKAVQSSSSEQAEAPVQSNQKSPESLKGNSFLSRFKREMRKGLFTRSGGASVKVAMGIFALGAVFGLLAYIPGLIPLWLSTSGALLAFFGAGGFFFSVLGTMDPKNASEEPSSNESEDAGLDDRILT